MSKKIKLTTYLFVLFFLGPFVYAQTDNVVQLRIEPVFFSPNGDGLQDKTFFSPVLRKEAEILRWRVDIRNDRNKLIRRITGAGFSALIEWDGLNKKNQIVSDGEYMATMTVWGRDFKATSEAKRIFVDSVKPLASVSVSTPVFDSGLLNEGIPLVFTPSVEDVAPVTRWQFQVFDLTGRSMHIQWSSGTLRDIEWDGKDDVNGLIVPKGKYRAVFVAWDAAGNDSEPAFVDVELNVSASELLSEVIQQIDVFETHIGLLVPARTRDIFEVAKSKPKVTEAGRSILKEVALLINAYPEAPVRLDGYSKKLKSASLDKNRSSFYAWAVYSYLVKEGNVKASRLTVRGRGRSPTFERREVDLDILQNGVEILLEGNGSWE